MLEQFFSRPFVLNRLRTGLFGIHLEALANQLQQMGYASTTIRGYLDSYDRYGRWLVQHHYLISDVSPELTRQYLSTLKRSPASYFPKAGQGLGHLCRWLQDQGVIAEKPMIMPETDATYWLYRYDNYLDQVVGTTASTRQRYCLVIKRFLNDSFGCDRVDWSILNAQMLAEFVQQEAGNKKGYGRKVPGVALRSLLRFLVFSGEIPPGLSAAIPTIRHWQQAALPKAYSGEQIEQALGSCDQSTPQGLRDHAILLLLARLGLRALEVVRLRLDDIDWHRSELIIQPGKTHQQRIMPLSQEVGQALAAYLKQGRPGSSSRIVFLQSRPPFNPFSGAKAVSWIARNALLRAGISPQSGLGAHRFRHSAATQMVCQGVSFKSVADVLGHRSLQTTGIYAKLDLQSLVPIALPWPGEAS